MLDTLNFSGSVNSSYSGNASVFRADPFINRAALSGSAWPVKKYNIHDDIKDIFKGYLLTITTDHNLDYRFADEISEVVYDGFKLKFKKEFILEIQFDGECFFYESDKYNVYCYGLSKKEVTNKFNEYIVINWKLYVDCDISELSLKAQKLRHFLQNNLEKV